MNYNANTEVEFEKPADNYVAKLKFIERQFKQTLDDWHFRLLERLNPNQVFNFFRNAKFIDKTIYFDGSTANGRTSYAWIESHYRDDLAAVFGNIRIALAKDRAIEKSFKTYFSDKQGYLTKPEIEFMFELAGRAKSGNKMDSVAELTTFRGEELF